MPILTRSDLAAIARTIQALAKELSFKCLASGGYVDHLHLLLSMAPHQSLARIIKSIKGRTSRENENLYWQTGYYVETVSVSGVGAVVDYIQNQWQMHNLRRLEDAGFFEPNFFPPN
jgi:putative transposase